MIIQGDCLQVLKTLPDNSVDSIVTDPPYGLSFMGKKWDYDVPSQEIWEECLRVLKYGGYLLAFAGTRTQHRMAVRIEDAGFEIRDMIAWVYGSGFPKSLNIGKAVDKLQGNERSVFGEKMGGTYKPENNVYQSALGVNEGKYIKITKGTSEWEGWGTALKPALEPITVARKPLEKGLTVAENCLKWGVGGLNIDGCRVETEDNLNGGAYAKNGQQREQMWGEGAGSSWRRDKGLEYQQPLGRFPANFIHDGSDEVTSLFPDDNARFFYTAKASKGERNEGCEGLPLGEAPASARSKPAEGRQNALGEPRHNNHPTVKPVDLMKYLCRLVTPKGGTVLDPFMGSGSTGIASHEEDLDFIGIEIDPEYFKIAEKRINRAKMQVRLTDLI